MLDKFLAQLYEEEMSKTASEQLEQAFMQLPLPDLQKIAGDLGVTFKKPEPEQDPDAERLEKFAQADRWGRELAWQHAGIAKEAQEPAPAPAGPEAAPPPDDGGMVIPPGNASDQAAGELADDLPSAIGAAVLAAAAEGKKAKEGGGVGPEVPPSGMPTPEGAPPPVAVPPSGSPQASVAGAQPAPGPAAPPVVPPPAPAGPAPQAPAAGASATKTSSIRPDVYRAMLQKRAGLGSSIANKITSAGHKLTGKGKTFDKLMKRTKYSPFSSLKPKA